MCVNDNFMHGAKAVFTQMKQIEYVDFHLA